MFKFLKKHLPSRTSIENSKTLKSLKPYYDATVLWSFKREPVARGVAAGLMGALLPGFQFFYAALLALIMRGNLPVALGLTFITNPFTVIPITYFIYWVGSWVVGNGKGDITLNTFHWDFTSFSAFWSNFSNWLLQFGKAFFVGLPIVSIGLGLLGYFVTVTIWRLVSACKGNKSKSK